MPRAKAQLTPAPTPTPPTTQHLTEKISEEIRFMVRKMLYPSPFLHWSEGLAGAERTGRIRRSKQSVLYYSISRYILSQLPEIPDSDGCFVEVFPLDTELEIRVSDGDTQTKESLVLPYPRWLRDFLDEDENFDLLCPDDTTSLEDTLDRVFSWCSSHREYEILVRPSS